MRVPGVHLQLICGGQLLDLRSLERQLLVLPVQLLALRLGGCHQFLIQFEQFFIFLHNTALSSCIWCDGGCIDAPKSKTTKMEMINMGIWSDKTLGISWTLETSHA